MRYFPALSHLLACTILGSAAMAAIAQEPTDADKAEYDSLSQNQRGGGGGGFGGGPQVTLSPDGTQLGWVGQPLDGKGPRGIWIMPVAGGDAHQISGFGGERNMRWSPDGTTIAFLSGGDSGFPQIYLAPSAGGDAKQLTNFNGAIQSPAYSPDGKFIAFLGIENPTRVSGATQPFKPQTGVVGTKADIQGIEVVSVATGKMEWVTPQDMYVYEFGWSPTSDMLIYTSAPAPGENNWWTAKLYTTDRVSDFDKFSLGTYRPIATLIATPDTQINRPRWSPDGKWIAYIGGLMSDFGSVGGDVYVVPAYRTPHPDAKGPVDMNGVRFSLDPVVPPQDITKGMRATANSITWTADNKIIVGEDVQGDSAFEMLDPTTGKREMLGRHAASISGPDGRNTAAISADGKTEAIAMNSVDHNTEIYVLQNGQPKQITHWADNDKADWGKVQSLHWKSGKFDVQGYLVWPANVEPGKKYPMIVDVHGGPAASYSAGWGTGSGQSFWSRAGYFVFLPNPRGSFGEGEEFTRANRKDFGYGDLDDIMAGVDEAIRTAPVDPDRLGLTGGSYGGYMTMWGVTHTHRFKAGVAVAGIANWKSYYGENSIDEWMIPYFGASVYDDPAVYAKSSPIEFIKNVQTPTLIAVGEFDGECPPPQSYEFWHALKDLGVPTELLVYPGEGHGVRQPDNRRDLQLRTLAWFNYYLKR